jgi:hypothetical protein
MGQWLQSLSICSLPKQSLVLTAPILTPQEKSLINGKKVVVPPPSLIVKPVPVNNSVVQPSKNTLPVNPVALPTSTTVAPPKVDNPTPKKFHLALTGLPLLTAIHNNDVIEVKEIS